MLCLLKPAKDSDRTLISRASWICTVNQANAEVLVPNKAKRAVDELLAAFRVQNLATIFLLMRDRDGSEFTPEERQVVEDNLQQAAAFFRYDHWEILQVWAMTPDRYQLRVRLHYTDAPSMDANIVVENLYDEWKITAFVQLIE